MYQTKQELEVIATLMELDEPLSEGVREWITNSLVRSRKVVRQQLSKAEQTTAEGP